jgi:hypothetical protein
MTHIGFDKINK